MSAITALPDSLLALPNGKPLPDHTQLPDKDGSFVINLDEPPQTRLLTETIEPHLNQIFPDRHYLIGRDAGIYWKLTDPPLKGCKAPDWFYVPDKDPLIDGRGRRSYVLWYEGRPPVVVFEVVSGDGSEEHDQTPETGKFWVYEQGIRVPYYVIFDAEPLSLEVFALTRGKYRKQFPDGRGLFLIEPLGLYLGLWEGLYETRTMTWVRWFDQDGRLMPTGDERTAEAERLAAAERTAKEQALEKVQRLQDRLRGLGIEPNGV